MSAELRARVLAAAAAEASPTRAATDRRNVLLGVAAAASGLASFFVFAWLMSDGRLLGIGGEAAPGQPLERSLGLVIATAGGALAVAASALWLALARGGSMLGRPRTLLLYGALLIPVSLFVWKVGCSIVLGGPMMEWPERPGLKCLSLSLLVAVGPLLSFLAIRRTAPVAPALNGALMGFTAGACAWFVVDLWCPVAYVPHLLIGHLLPLFVLAAAGALLGAALLRPGRRR